MKQLNKDATKLFLLLLDKGKGSDTTVYAGGAEPLHLAYGQKVQTEVGSGTVVTVGKLRDLREMSYSVRVDFIVIDPRTYPSGGASDVLVFPCAYFDHVEEIEEESVRISEGKVEKVFERHQAAHCRFTHGWLQGLKREGYIK